MIRRTGRVGNGVSGIETMHMGVDGVIMTAAMCALASPNGLWEEGHRGADSTVAHQPNHQAKEDGAAQTCMCVQKHR
jgi:hypothetical protein